MHLRKSTIYLCLASMGSLILIWLLFGHPFMVAGHHNNRITANRQLVQKLLITDLCLFTESRYTRHLSQADLHSAFQDHPHALEHFPSGSLTLPPHRIGTN